MKKVHIRDGIQSATLYELLGVENFATTDDIRKQYQRLILQYHPDKNLTVEGIKGPSTRPSSDVSKRSTLDIFHDIQRAWDTLRDPEQRKAYDLQLHYKTQQKEVMISDVIDLDDMLYKPEEHQFSWPCRCGDQFLLREQDLDSGYNVIQCESCSLHVQLRYSPDDFSEAKMTAFFYCFCAGKIGDDDDQMEKEKGAPRFSKAKTRRRRTVK